MRGTAPKEDQRWSLTRAPAYISALQAVGRRRFRHAYRHLLEAERLIVSTEGNPPDVWTVETAGADENVGSTDLIEEACSIDQEYDQEHYEHHAPRVRCFIYKGILVCFTVCDMSELITMTAFRLPDEIFSDLDDSVSSDMRGYDIAPVHPLPGHLMELNRTVADRWNAQAVNIVLSQRYDCARSNQGNVEVSVSPSALENVAHFIEIDLAWKTAKRVRHMHTLTVTIIGLCQTFTLRLLK